MEVFFNNIENVILENFDRAEKSIVIAVAWFTNKRIVSRLIDLKRFKNIDIQILTDENETNRKYFFELFQRDLESAGIELKTQHFKKFNHNKFAVIDDEKVITGSYNYTYKANSNSENIVIEVNRRTAGFYTRVFNFFTDSTYVDPNVEILMENFDFANKLLSMNYPFSKKLMTKLKTKITLGYCFTHENGLYDEISYEPGLIFNKKFSLHNELGKGARRRPGTALPDLYSEYLQEFDLPIEKKLIVDFQADEINDFNYQTIRETADYEDSKIDYDRFAEDCAENQKALELYYTRKFSAIYSPDELREMIGRGIDIVIEDYIWNNFAPFLNDSIVERIYRDR